MTADNKSIKFFPTPGTLAYVPAKQDFDLFRRSPSAKLRLVFPATKELTAQRDLFLLAPARKQPVVPNVITFQAQKYEIVQFVSGQNAFSD